MLKVIAYEYLLDGSIIATLSDGTKARVYGDIKKGDRLTFDPVLRRWVKAADHG